MAKSKGKCKRIPKHVLKLPDLEQSKSAVLNSLTSRSSQRTYDHAIREFIEWYCSEPRLAFNKTVVTRYRISLEQQHYASTTINLRLAAVRRLAYEAADCGLLSVDRAAGIRRVKGARRLGAPVGNWLTAEQGKRLLLTADRASLRGKRDYATLAILLGCGLRRAELTALRVEDIQQREEHWVIADLVGKGGHMRAFLAWSEQEHKQHPATHRRYLVSSAALLRCFGDQPLDKITQDAVEQFKAARSVSKGQRTKRLIKPATVNQELACLRAMFNHAIKADLLLKNPVCKNGVKAFHEDNEQTRVLSFDEQARYLAAATPILRDVATIMLETGMRPEEVYRIQPENVNLASGLLFNPHGKTKAARRWVPLNSAAKSVLARRMEGLETPFLFPCETDPTRPVPKVNNAHDRAVRDSKVTRFRLYDLRHTWATRAAEAGIDLVTLAALLGHSKIQMVLRYAHPTQEHQARSVERLEQFNATKQMEALLPEQGAAERTIQ